MGFRDLSREAKATRGDIAEPRTSRLSQILPSPEPTPQLHVFRAKLSQESDEVMPVAVADPQCFCVISPSECATSAGLRRGEEAGRG